MNKLLQSVAISAAVGCAAVSGAQAEQVRVGVTPEPYPPFVSQDSSGNWYGWEIDMMNALCAEADLECVITPVAWDGLIPALNSGKIDMIIAAMKITDERLKTIDFSDRYLSTPSGIIAWKDQDIKPTAESLSGKILGMQTGTTHQTYAEKYFVPGGTEIRTYPMQDDAHNDLVAGRIDAVQADTVAVMDFLASEAGQCCELKGTVENDPAVFGYGTAIGLRKGDTELKEKMNAALATIRANGVYDGFSKKYFDFDVYGD